MSVRILYKNDQIREYDPEEPIGSQISNAKSVTISTEDDLGRAALTFLEHLKVVSKISILQPFKINVMKESTLAAKKAQRQAKEIHKSLTMNWALKELIKSQISVETKISDLVDVINEIGSKDAS